MSAAAVALVQAGGLVERIRDVVAVLAVSVTSGDVLTASYAASSLEGLAGQVDELMFTARTGSGALARIGF